MRATGAKTGLAAAAAAAAAIAAVFCARSWRGRHRHRPTAAEGPVAEERRPRSRDPVDEAVEESFPASDPPSYTPGHAGPPRH